jgi:hypothetical protein
MGGTIRVASRKGVGTTFSVTLPYNGPTPSTVEPILAPSLGDGQRLPIPVPVGSVGPSARAFTAEAAAVVQRAEGVWNEG